MGRGPSVVHTNHNVVQKIIYIFLIFFTGILVFVFIKNGVALGFTLNSRVEKKPMIERAFPEVAYLFVLNSCVICLFADVM